LFGRRSLFGFLLHAFWLRLFVRLLWIISRSFLSTGPVGLFGLGFGLGLGPSSCFFRRSFLC
jgi:hypothetical protein